MSPAEKPSTAAEAEEAQLEVKVEPQPPVQEEGAEAEEPREERRGGRRRKRGGRRARLLPPATVVATAAPAPPRRRAAGVPPVRAYAAATPRAAIPRRAGHPVERGARRVGDIASRGLGHPRRERRQQRREQWAEAVPDQVHPAAPQGQIMSPGFCAFSTWYSSKKSMEKRHDKGVYEA